LLRGRAERRGIEAGPGCCGGAPSVGGSRRAPAVAGARRAAGERGGARLLRGRAERRGGGGGPRGCGGAARVGGAGGAPAGGGGWGGGMGGHFGAPHLGSRYTGGMKLRNHILLLVVATVVPMTLFAAALIFYNARLQQQAAERGMRDTVRALALALDREIHDITTGVQTLAASRHLDDPPDLRRFYEDAVSVSRNL